MCCFRYITRAYIAQIWIYCVCFRDEMHEGWRNARMLEGGTLRVYLAHKKSPPPGTLQSDHAQYPMGVLGGGAFSYERGTPVRVAGHNNLRVLIVRELGTGIGSVGTRISHVDTHHERQPLRALLWATRSLPSPDIRRKDTTSSYTSRLLSDIPLSTFVSVGIAFLFVY